MMTQATGRYKLIHDDDWDIFHQKVNNAINEGWVPLGGVSTHRVDDGSDNAYTSLNQAFTRSLETSHEKRPTPPKKETRLPSQYGEYETGCWPLLVSLCVIVAYAIGQVAA